jgi:hypothetical protein
MRSDTELNKLLNDCQYASYLIIPIVDISTFALFI